MEQNNIEAEHQPNGLQNPIVEQTNESFANLNEYQNHSDIPVIDLDSEMQPESEASHVNTSLPEHNEQIPIIDLEDEDNTGSSRPNTNGMQMFEHDHGYCNNNETPLWSSLEDPVIFPETPSAELNQKNITRKTTSLNKKGLPMYSSGGSIVDRPYKCLECGRRYIRHRDLISHVKMHIQQNEYVCHHCKLNFKKKSELLLHNWTNHNSPNKSIYNCPECDLSFKKHSKLLLHTKTHLDAGNMFPCRQCRMEFNSLYELVNHNFDHKSKPQAQRTPEKPVYSPQRNSQYPCPHCKRIFKKPHFRRNHIAQVHKNSVDEKPLSSPSKILRYSCPHCNKVFKQERTWLIHITKVHGSPENKNLLPSSSNVYPCPHCSVVFQTLQEKQKHITDVHENSKIDKPLSKQLKMRGSPCPHCEKHFKKSRDRFIHIVNVHRKPHCIECKLTFPDINSQEIHKQVHEIALPDAGNHDEPSQVLLESEESGNVTLQNPPDNPTNEDQVYNCEVCEATFNHPASLTYHSKNCHSLRQLLKFRCKLCNFRSTFSKDLVYHHQIHFQQLKHYRCFVCGDLSTSLELLHKHLRMVHGVSDPLRCDKCPMAFRSLDELELHLRTHNGETKLDCIHCDKKFMMLDIFKNLL